MTLLSGLQRQVFCAQADGAHLQKTLSRLTNAKIGQKAVVLSAFQVNTRNIGKSKDCGPAKLKLEPLRQGCEREQLQLHIAA